MTIGKINREYMKGKFSLRMKAVESDLDLEKLLGSYQVTM